MTPEQQEILARAGAPPDAQYYMIFDQSSHLDYDWLVDFPTYYNTGYNGSTPVKDIYPQALTLLQGSTDYFYSICEMDYFRQYLTDNLDQVAAFQAVGDQLRLAGGGITSPDNLLSHGEAFIRTYLVGRLWLEKTLPNLLPIRVCWIPDDFGHDPELPATLQALGMTATSFWRVPGNTAQAPTPSLVTTMYEQGLDFTWQASDGSAIFAHWLQGGYPQGSGIDGGAGPIANIQSYIDSYWSSPNQQGTFGARTPYLYVPLDNDFSAPVPDLLTDLASWNSSPDGFPKTGVYAVALPFADFARLVQQYDAATPSLSTVRFDGRPYWTGHYMSRVALKIMHYDVARTLLSAETLALMAGPGGALAGSFPADLLSAWDAFSPSTHHDFVNGTATDAVYRGEQTSELTASTSTARGLVQTALTALTASVPTDPRSGETAVVVANSLGVSYEGLVELASPPAGTWNGVRFGDGTGPVQQSADGGLLFMAKVPPTSWATGYLTGNAGSGTTGLSLRNDGTTYTLSNEHLTAVVSLAAPYYGGISLFLDADGNAVLSGGPGNHVVVYQDNGDIYEFGYEYVAPGYSQYHGFTPLTPTGTTVGAVTVLENGPLRVMLQVPVQLALSGKGSFSATLQYSLTAGEPFLRMSISGAAPSGTSVTVQFPFAQPIDGMWNGTANHWTSMQQADIDGWSNPVFRPTHRFVLPRSGGDTLAAVYHPEVPAWAWNGSTLVGCVLRNTPNKNGHGAAGSDGDSHTLHYALRPATGLGDPATGQPLTESLRYAWPPLAAAVTGATSGTLAAQGFVAYVADGTGVILAAKPGDVAPGSTVLRLYQPTNGTETLSIQLPRAAKSAIAVTALEDPLATAGPKVSLSGSTLTVVMPNALATVQVT